MDIKIKIKEEAPSSDDVASQNQREFFPEVVTMKRSSDAVLVDNNCDVAFKSETPFIKHGEMQIKCETFTCSNKWEIHRKIEIEQQTLLSDFVSQAMKDKYSSGDEMDNKTEIKQEPCWLETETSFVSEDIKDEDFPSVTSSRWCMEALSGASSGKSPLSSAEVSGSDKSFCNGKDFLECERQKSDVTEMPAVEKHIISEQYDKYGDGAEMITRLLKTKNFSHQAKRPHSCNICGKEFSWLSHLKMHYLIHEGKKHHQCEICGKRFTQLSSLKTHNLIHEGKKPHQCNTCDRRFTRLSHLKTHNLIHEGKKLYQCKTCDKRFTQLSCLKRHNLIHEGKKPHQCKTCDKRFTQLSYLKTHYWLHEGKRPHQCKTCDKGFTQLSTLKRHNLIHEGKNPHQCEICGKRFTQLSSLKTHNLVHEGRRAHQCKTCDKSFTRLSSLKRHNLSH